LRIVEDDEAISLELDPVSSLGVTEEEELAMTLDEEPSPRELED